MIPTASHLNGIPLGLEHMRWALTDIGRLIGKDGKQISEAAGHHREGEEPATPETHEERQRRLLSEVQEFTRLLSATYDARSEEEARAANKALDEYVEREAKKPRTARGTGKPDPQKVQGTKHKHVTAALLAKSHCYLVEPHGTGTDSQPSREREKLFVIRRPIDALTFCIAKSPTGQGSAPNNICPDTRRSRRQRATRIWRRIRSASPRCGCPNALRVACLPDTFSRLAKRAKGLILNAHNPQAVDRPLRAAGRRWLCGFRIPGRGRVRRGAIPVAVRLVRQGRRRGPVAHRPGDDGGRLRGGIVEMGVDGGGAPLAVPEQPSHRDQPNAVHDALSKTGEGRACPSLVP